MTPTVARIPGRPRVLPSPAAPRRPVQRVTGFGLRPIPERTSARGLRVLKVSHIFLRPSVVAATMKPPLY